jgi:hypothetical protein
LIEAYAQVCKTHAQVLYVAFDSPFRLRPRVWIGPATVRLRTAARTGGGSDVRDMRYDRWLANNAKQKGRRTHPRY